MIYLFVFPCDGCKSNYRCLSVRVILFLISLYCVCAWQKIIHLFIQCRHSCVSKIRRRIAVTLRRRKWRTAIAEKPHWLLRRCSITMGEDRTTAAEHATSTGLHWSSWVMLPLNCTDTSRTSRLLWMKLVNEFNGDVVDDDVHASCLMQLSLTVWAVAKHVAKNRQPRNTQLRGR